jgi:hypothetical protein
MKTPGLCNIRKYFASASPVLNSMVLFSGVPFRFMAATILVIAMIPPVGAAPQSAPNYPSNNATQAPTFSPAGRSGGGSSPAIQMGTLTATPSSVNFSSVPMGFTNSQSVSLMNTGSVSVQITRASVNGGSFKASGLAASTTISPGQSITFNILFRPSSATAFASTATIYSNASNSPISIPLSGTGAASSALLGTSPASLSFGNVTVGASSTLNVSLTNSGNVNITIYKVNVPSSAFTTSGVSGGVILGPSQTATLAVTYSPTSQAAASGNISLSTSASSSQVKIPVSGAGVQSAPESVSLNWQASSSPGVIGYYVYRGTVSGGPYTALNSSPVTSTQYVDSSVQAGMTYYYVVTSVDSGNMQSGFSSQVSANVPAQ